MKKYRRRPLIVEAYQSTREILVMTLEGPVLAKVGDWIVTGTAGETYPVKPHIFEMSFDLVPEDQADDSK